MLHILVVDDDKNTRLFLKAVLEGADYTVTTAVDGEDALAVMREIEAAGGIPFTGIVNNSNLGELTTPSTVTASQKKAEALSRLSGLPLCFTAAEVSVAKALDCVFPLHLQSKYFDIKGEETWQK